MEDQRGEEGPLLGWPKVYGIYVHHHLEGTEYPKVHPVLADERYQRPSGRDGRASATGMVPLFALRALYPAPRRHGDGVESV
jgi:hypothetical protein